MSLLVLCWWESRARPAQCARGRQQHQASTPATGKPRTSEQAAFQQNLLCIFDLASVTLLPRGVSEENGHGLLHHGLWAL